MSTPPFTIKLWIYPGANPSSAPSTWGVQQDISAYIRHPGNDGGQAVTYTAGRQDEGAQVDAGTLSLTLDNRGGQFSTGNVLGVWYNQLDLGTPIVLGTQSGYDTFTRVTASGLGTSDSGQTYSAAANWSTDGSSAFCSFAAVNTAYAALMSNAQAADYDMVLTTWPTVTVTGGAMISAGIQAQDVSNYILFRVDFGAAGTMSARIQRVGGAGSSTLATTDPAGYTHVANQKFRIRCQRDGYQLRMKVWPALSAEPAAWQCVTTESSILAGDLGMYSWRLNTNTNASPVTQGFDDLEINAVEWTGNLVQLPVRWDKSGNNCWAPISAAGIMRRLQQGKGARKSPLGRQLSAYGPTGFWRLEDESGATSGASDIAGVAPAFFRTVSPAADSTLPGASTSVVFQAPESIIKVSTHRVHTSTGFAAMFFTKISAIPVAKTALATFATTGRATRWVISLDATNQYVDVYDADGVLLSAAVNLWAPQDMTKWVGWQLETEVVGANTNYSLYNLAVGDNVYYLQNGSYVSSTVSQVKSLQIGSTNWSGTAVAMIWFGPNTLPFFTYAFAAVADGYRGELAADRITRLCLEEGILASIESGVTDPCGPQQEAGALEALRAAADADMGILYERGTGLGFRPRAARYVQPVLLPLTVAAGQIDEPPEPINDDQRRANAVTVSRVGGSSATVTDDTSVAKIGYYPGPAVSLNVQTDDVLPFHAGWRVYLGTRRDLRWPGLTLNFARNPTLLPLWRKRGYGPRMTVVTAKSQVVGSDPDVIIEGYACTLWPTGWKASLNCSIATGWDQYTFDDDLERLDADNSTLDTAMATPTVGSCQVTNNGDTNSTWAPTSILPAEVPFYVQIDGEIAQVTAVGNIFSTTKQTLTLTRNINGGATAHAAGAQVRLAYPIILAL